MCFVEIVNVIIKKMPEGYSGILPTKIDVLLILLFNMIQILDWDKSY
jgi:hypothetical protein